LDVEVIDRQAVAHDEVKTQKVSCES